MPDTLLATGWLEVAHFNIYTPNGITSTLYKHNDRLIDYAIVSASIFPLIRFLIPIWGTPWRPHISLLLAVIDKPMSLFADVLLHPKPLPMDEALKVYSTLTDAEVSLTWTRSLRAAKRKLNKAKRRTGIAILGRPSEALLSDPKFSGEYKAESIRVGEGLAEATLSSELFVLSLAGVPDKEQHMFTGRSQYLKILSKPVRGKNAVGPKFADTATDVTVEAVNCIQAWADGNISDNPQFRGAVLSAFHLAHSCAQYA